MTTNDSCFNLLPMVEDTNKHQDFANRLNRLMDSKGLSVKQLSAACKVTYEMARRYTLGTAKPRDEKMIKIAEWLGVEPSWLDYGAGEDMAVIPVADTGRWSGETFSPIPVNTESESEFNELSDIEKRLLRTFRQFPDIEAQNMVLVFEMRLKELKTHYKKYFDTRDK